MLRDLPAGAFGAAMGLAGLALAGRAAAPALAGIVPAPAYFTEPWVALSVVALAVLLPAYLWKLARSPAAVREELTDPARMGFCAALPLALVLVAGGIGPYLPGAAKALWWTGFAALLALQVWGFVRVLEGGIALAQVNAGWMLLFIGGIVLPGSGVALGEAGAARFAFGVSAAATPFVMALVFYRAALAPPLPEALRPTWFILLVPPALVYAHGRAFFPDLVFLENLYFFGWMLAAGLVVYARRFLRWPFSAAWWAFTFPLGALAHAAARYALEHPAPLARGAAAAALLLAALFVLIALGRTLAAAAAALRAAAPPRA
jgi:tellurite resistance protein